MAPGYWTEERTQTLIELWRDGFSAAEIAVKMGGGLSRNAIIGRDCRLGLSRSGDVPMVTKPRAVVSAVLALESGQCRFPVGQVKDADFHFCSEPQRDGAIYCEAHMKLTHLPRETTAAADRRAEKQARSAA